MRYLIIALSLIVIACGGEKTTPNTQAQASPNQTPTQNQNTTAASNDGEFATPEQIAAISTPVMGGPADFTVKIAGAQPGRSDLIAFYAEQHFKIDTAVISSNGTIKFKNEEGYPQGIYYVSFAPERYLQIILGEDQKFTLETSIQDPDGMMKVKGSDENQAFFESIAFEKIKNPLFDDLGRRLKQFKEGSVQYTAVRRAQDSLADIREAFLQDMYKKYPGTLFSKFKQAGQNPRLRDDVPQEQVVYHYRRDFWNNVDFNDRRLLRTQVIYNKLKRYFEELTPQNQDSIISSAYYLNDLVLKHPEYFKFFANWVVRVYEPTKCTLMDPEKVFVKMVQKYFTKEKAFWADSLNLFAIHQKSSEMANSLVGEKGPDVIANDLQGKEHRLFASKADYLVVYMFAPSCEHCQEQTPKLVTWHNEWKNKGADVYAIALDTSNEELQGYINKTGMKFPVVYDPTNRSIYAKYYVDITPEIYVLNPERTVIGKNLKVFQIETVINRDKEKR